MNKDSLKDEVAVVTGQVGESAMKWQERLLGLAPKCLLQRLTSRMGKPLKKN